MAILIHLLIVKSRALCALAPPRFSAFTSVIMYIGDKATYY